MRVWAALGYLRHDDHHQEFFSLFKACVVSVNPSRFIIFLPCSQFVCKLWLSCLWPFSSFINVSLINSVRVLLELYLTIYFPQTFHSGADGLWELVCVSLINLLCVPVFVACGECQVCLLNASLMLWCILGLCCVLWIFCWLRACKLYQPGLKQQLVIGQPHDRVEEHWWRKTLGITVYLGYFFRSELIRLQSLG